MIKLTTSKNITCNLISAYAPTLENTIKNPEETNAFYDELTSLLKLNKNRDAVIIGGDFNAKTKLSTYNSQRVVGKYAKSQINKNERFW